MKTFFSDISVVPNWLWLSFSIAILFLLFIDLSLFSKGHKKSRTKIALIESGIWIALALCFNAWFAYSFGTQLGIEFLTGYLVEKSLSIDNLFIILLIFSSFNIPSQLQHKALFYGVLGAIVMRALFIILGAHLLNSFHWILYFFGLILIVTGIKLLFKSEDKSNLKESLSIWFLKKIIPTTDKFHGANFFIIDKGINKATPLFLALIAIEVTDLVFAVDSIPAVFAVTKDAFVAFASNIFAILGLRALYFVLAEWIVKLRYLKPGLATILLFIGIKMILIDYIKIPSWVSLLIVFTVLVTAGLTSWYVSKFEKK
ncbi:TerC/Alx family metal homeostasis membrane protein [Fluviispira multicolorata]|uniref:TerC/Alx family metal homeostasis membrane protein n=1 Tax=Fluviispira multicolorata TaxID=2654512 RepID=A0A833N5I1_9BACT|nr:TerC/Alx family metal homeostasis membrane protein [Fluviispira multicolorata]KAB8030772.1 TerC/Alx family metal homeostasis membrane protein [Fluviispira multicolorata]